MMNFKKITGSNYREIMYIINTSKGLPQYHFHWINYILFLGAMIGR